MLAFLDFKSSMWMARASTRVPLAWRRITPNSAKLGPSSRSSLAAEQERQLTQILLVVKSNLNHLLANGANGANGAAATDSTVDGEG